GNARRGHLDDDDTDAFVLWRIRLSAHEAEAEICIVRTRRPDLLTVDNPFVAIEYGAGAQTSEVAARIGFAHAETPGDLAAQRRDEEALLLRLGAVVENRGRDDAQTLRVQGARYAPTR